MQKIHALLGLFILILVVLFLNPRVINEANNSVLGRMVMICVILFFTVHNTTLGLLVALCLIIAVNMFFMEGFEAPVSASTEESAAEPAMPVNNITKQEAPVTPGDKKKEPTNSEDGVDTQTAHESIQPMDSNAIPVSKSDFASSEVSALNPVAAKQGFALFYS